MLNESGLIPQMDGFRSTFRCEVTVSIIAAEMILTLF